MEKRNTLLDSGMTLAAVTAYLYCASAANYDGFLVPLRLDSDVLDRNFHQTLYSGFLLSFGPALLALIIYAISRLFYSHALLPEIHKLLRKNWKRKRLFLKIKQRLYGKRKDPIMERREKKHSITASLFAAGFFISLLTLVYFEAKGKDAAQLILRNIDTKSIKDHELINVSINGQAVKLVYLACGARNCAGIDPITRLVQYFPQNGHAYHLPASKKNSDSK